MWQPFFRSFAHREPEHQEHQAFFQRVRCELDMTKVAQALDDHIWLFQWINLNLSVSLLNPNLTNMKAKTWLEKHPKLRQALRRHSDNFNKALVLDHPKCTDQKKEAFNELLHRLRTRPDSVPAEVFQDLVAWFEDSPAFSWTFQENADDLAFLETILKKKLHLDEKALIRYVPLWSELQQQDTPSALRSASLWSGMGGHQQDVLFSVPPHRAAENNTPQTEAPQYEVFFVRL